jgi:Holliday junction resolvase RusA-like endonuclease
MIEISVNEVVPSLNRLLRLHWSARRRLRKKWEWIVFAEAYRVGGPLAIKFQGVLEVTIVRSYYRVPLDADNLHGAAKIVLDALKTAKVIADDSPAHIALICQQIQGLPRTTIRVAPINASIAAAGSPGELPVTTC